MRFCLALLLALAPLALQAQTFSSLEERMSEAEFRAAGLDKLAPEELAALNAWLRDRPQAASAAPVVAAPPQVEDRRGFGILDGGRPEAIVSRISGEFAGWRGSGDLIKLDNGQVWKTTDPNSRLAVKLSNPVVVVSPGMLNAWFLKVQGYNASVRVIRVR